MIKTTCLGCGKPFRDCVCNTTLDPWKGVTGDTVFPDSPYSYPITGDTEVGFVIDDRLIDLVKSIRNRCDVVLTLVEHYGTESLIPTVLEDLYFGTQTMAELYCVKDD